MMHPRLEAALRDLQVDSIDRHEAGEILGEILGREDRACAHRRALTRHLRSWDCGVSRALLRPMMGRIA